MQDLFSIRALTKEEWQSFGALRLDALAKYPHVYFGSFPEEEKHPPSYWQDQLSQEETRVFGLFDKGQLVGMAIVAPLPNQAGIPLHDDAVVGMGSVYMRPDYHKRGLAARLGQTCLDWSRSDKKWQRMMAAHRASNEASRRLLVRLGLARFETLRSKCYPNGDRDDEDWYQIDLKRSDRPRREPDPRSPSL